MREDADLKWVLIVEDDCVPCLHPAAESQWAAFYGPAWQVAWRHIAKAMESCGEDFDFVYVGRHRLGPEDESDAVVRPAGFSSCLHAYCVTRQGCDRLLEKSANVPLVPADDLRTCSMRHAPAQGLTVYEGAAAGRLFAERCPVPAAINSLSRG